MSCPVWSRAPQGVYYEKAIRFRRWAADHVQSLIEGTYGRRMKAWGGIVDSLINNIMFETRDLHLRQEREKGSVTERYVFLGVGVVWVGPAVSGGWFAAAGVAIVGPRHGGTPLRLLHREGSGAASILPEVEIARPTRRVARHFAKIAGGLRLHYFFIALATGFCTGGVPQ